MIWKGFGGAMIAIFGWIVALIMVVAVGTTIYNFLVDAPHSWPSGAIL